WRRHWPAGRGGALLSAVTRPRRRIRAANVDSRVRGRRAEPPAARARSNARRGAPAAPARAVAACGGMRGTMTTAALSPAAFDVTRVRADFPILQRRVHGKPLVYLDNAATTQKPQTVIDRIVRYYREENANIHRGVHALSVEATDAYDAAREQVRRFLNAAEAREIVFVRGATEGINLVAATYGRAHVHRGDEVLISEMEHHSNIVPWQMVCEERGAVLRIVPITDTGELRLDEYERLLRPRTRIVAITHVSNALGTVNPVTAITQMAHQRGAVVVVDGAQAVAHMPAEGQAIGCDFYVFSGHKIFGPTGIGVLYGRAALLEDMPPYQGGGELIRRVAV